MIVLNRPVKSLKSADIVGLCEQGVIEGIQLDYKKELPRDLSKHFAAMSNTRGGLIILGVEEDEKTGKPIKWDGLAYESKIIDRIRQFASNVDPLPSYEVVTTDATSIGHVFVLIRIFDGDRTPYYIQNDANLWVRTGNVSHRINLASPKEVALLLGKKEVARLARENSLKRCKDIQEAALKRASTRRMQVAKRQPNPLATAFANKMRGAQCTVMLQPFHPHHTFISPRELLAKLHALRVEDPYTESFPAQGGEAIPDGALIFQADSQSGGSCGQQLHANGILYESRDIVKPWNHLEALDAPQIAQVTVYENQLAARLWTILRSAQRFYHLLGYNGSLCGVMTLHGAQELPISYLTPSGDPLLETAPPILLSEYEWELQLDTAQLSDDESLRAAFIDFFQDVSWGLGNTRDITQALRGISI